MGGGKLTIYRKLTKTVLFDLEKFLLKLKKLPGYIKRVFFRYPVN